MNFEEELKKFEPSPELDEADEIYRRDLTDVMDILQELVKQQQSSK